MDRFVAFALVVIASCGIGNGVSAQNIPESYKQMFPSCRLGEDKNGAGVYHAPFTQWQFEELAENGTPEEKKAFGPWVDEVISKFKKDTGKKGEGVIVVLDCNGVDMQEFTPGISKLAGKLQERDEELSQVIKKLLIINNGISPLKLGLLQGYLKEVMSKAEIYGSDQDDWEPALQKRIPKDVLPKRLGGTNTMPPECGSKNKKQKKKESESGLEGLLG